ncbi:hypothetical protein KY290_032992 [Solanum tuberosum]|uniref:ZF-HD dimerization-type domain-containing protein n=2 Tax=Solanum tuberosum TaxID=4113 RepID=A0ABQ7UDT2_SOLTU|nr:PREDICTED: zinc-finger homeodomain protein 10-like [Solanum tuberosum]KAH0651589.1 hypothetical protein KY284_031501 [Solanum tuberosum]KAH0654258.1 hypothetical protein KY289_031936 [Solanum tuberosum]KAH0656834.1 hypothetical protein KY285_031716 [Solanum tuberosum]KAH0744999.1 hypothetical protein KY290_032992 [Solanum tuberosum]
MELSNNNSTIYTKTPEAETARIIQHNKPFSITNGILKRQNHHPLPLPVVVVYKECLKNHAATMGAHAVDGCGEFMPSPTATATNPTSLKCAACGCHRNFHRREPEELFPPPNTAAALQYQSHHRHHPPPPLPNRGSGDHSCPNSPSPPPISSAYYPSAPHMLLALSSGLSGRPVENNNNHLPINPNSTTPVSNPNGRKRYRTKFTQNQKEKMLEFSERVGWRMQKQDEEIINKLCHEISVEKGVLKVWMHNNKNNFGRKDQSVSNNYINGINFGISSTNDNNKEETHSHGVSHNNIVSVVATNGSSS